jgi:hypothetical protein
MVISAKKIFRTTFLSTLLLLASALPVLPNIGGTETHYDVVAKGLRIGSMVVSQRTSHKSEEPVVHFENLSNINASFLWVGYHVSMTERGTISNNDLVSYSRHGKENGVEVSIDGKLNDATFVFNVVRNGKRSTVEILRTSYDHTTMECPEATMEFGASGEVSLKILDTEYVAIVKRRYKLVKEDTYKIGGREFRCRVVDIVDPNKSCRRWIGRDGNAVILFRQDGRSRDGSYSVRAVALNRHQ